MDKAQTKQYKFNVRIVFVLLILIVLVVIYFIQKIKKEKENKLLKERLDKLLTKKEQIELRAKKLDRYYKTIYLLLKMVFAGVIFGLCFIIYLSMQQKNIWEFASKFTDLFGMLGLVTIILCILCEIKFTDIFGAKEKVKSVLNNIIYGEHKAEILMLPIIEMDIISITTQLEERN